MTVNPRERNMDPGRSRGPARTGGACYDELDNGADDCFSFAFEHCYIAVFKTATVRSVLRWSLMKADQDFSIDLNVAGVSKCFSHGGLLRAHEGKFNMYV